MTAPHILAGNRAEQAAARWLQARGLQHVCANYRCRVGELDLIMLDHNCLVIIEVRYRRGSSFGGALGSVTMAKQNKIRRATLHYLQRHAAYRHHRLRFDVLAISTNSGKLSFQWHKRAFYADNA